MRTINVISEPCEAQNLEFFDQKTDEKLNVFDFIILDRQDSHPETSIPLTLELIETIPDKIDYEIVFLDDGSDSYIIAVLLKEVQQKESKHANETSQST